MTTTLGPNRLAYVRFMRLMAWTAVACTAAYVVPRDLRPPRRVGDLMSAPQWAPVDDTTADLLTVLADPSPMGSAVDQWWEFVDCLRHCAKYGGGVVRPNDLRPLVRGQVAPRRIGPFTRRACLEGLIAPNGEWETSDDTEGRNSGRPMRCYSWLGVSW